DFQTRAGSGSAMSPGWAARVRPRGAYGGVLRDAPDSFGGRRERRSRSPVAATRAGRAGVAATRTAREGARREAGARRPRGRREETRRRAPEGDRRSADRAA